MACYWNKFLNKEWGQCVPQHINCCRIRISRYISLVHSFLHFHEVKKVCVVCFWHHNIRLLIGFLPVRDTWTHCSAHDSKKVPHLWFKPSYRTACHPVATNQTYRSHCCDRKARVASAQSFTLWQQATTEITCHDHSVIACSRHIYVVLFFAHIPFVVSRTFNATSAKRLQQHQLPLVA